MHPEWMTAIRAAADPSRILTFDLPRIGAEARSGTRRLVLLALLATVVLSCAAAAQTGSPAPVLPDHLRWVCPTGSPGFQAAWALGSEQKAGPYIIRVKLAAGVRIPPHAHPDERNTTVLTGTILVGFGDTPDGAKAVAVPAGAVYVAPANAPHWIWARDGDAVYQEAGVGPTGTAFTRPPEAGGGEKAVPPAGSEGMVDVGGRQLHCFTYGQGPPTVVLASGLETPQEYWKIVVPALAERATVVTYDRAGIGRSEIGGLPAHGEQAARDLRALLEKLKAPKPYLLVGHSYGGSVVRLFASMYPGDVCGIVLEETQHEDALDEMRKVLTGKDLETFETVLLPRFAAPASPRTESDYRSATREQLRKSKPLPKVPLVVLMCPERARSMKGMFSDGAIEAMVRADAALMRGLAASVPGGRLIPVEGTGHEVHVDKPEALVAPVVQMIEGSEGCGGAAGKSKS